MSEFNSNSIVINELEPTMTHTWTENLDIAHTWTENLNISHTSQIPEQEKLAVG